jgi:hypothetical protein
MDYRALIELLSKLYSIYEARLSTDILPCSADCNYKGQRSTERSGLGYPNRADYFYIA